MIPLMVYYEAKRGLPANNAAAKLRIFDELCEKLKINDLTIADMNTAAVIYAEHKQNGAPMDAIC